MNDTNVNATGAETRTQDGAVPGLGPGQVNNQLLPAGAFKTEDSPEVPAAGIEISSSPSCSDNNGDGFVPVPGSRDTLLKAWSFDQSGKATETFTAPPEDTAPAPLPEAPPGQTIMREYTTVCPECGMQVRERLSINDHSRLLFTEYSACRCTPDPAELEKERKARSWQQIDACLGELNLAGLPGPTLDDLIPRPGQEEALNTARLFLRTAAEGKSLLLSGPPGRGKTELALALARSAAACRTVVFIKSVDLLDRIRRSLWEDSHKTAIASVLRGVDLLVIDDIGVEKVTEWVQATLYAIIDYRYGRRDTVYTSNLTGKEMVAKLGPALTSRICGSREVTVSGSDWRIASRHLVSAGWLQDSEQEGSLW